MLGIINPLVHLELPLLQLTVQGRDANTQQVSGGLFVACLDFIKTENLYAFDGVKGYSAGQGE
jgi:hypothetical protein